MTEVIYGFFSYAHTDAEPDEALYDAFSRELEARLHAQFVNATAQIWRDKEGLSAGVKWNRRIEENLRASKLLIVMLSPKWLSSDYCRKELSIFLEIEKALGAEELVVPILVRDVASKFSWLTDEQKKVYEEQLSEFDLTTSLRCCRTPTTTRRQSSYFGAHWKSKNIRLGHTIPKWQPQSTTLPG